ncbi:hypothetical protein QUA70_19775 [Microcoleus sp. LAD1_D5]|uniref:hypothetical protein n=1 Tax=Microcoleus sp. LAD1_D5 TaxID=2818813 RepID=UPI002FD57084
MVEPHYPNPIDYLDLPKDLSRLSKSKQNQIYTETCDRLGLNPLSFPLDLIKGKNGSTLMINEIGASQLRAKHSISIAVKSHELLPYQETITDPETRTEKTVTRYLAIVTVTATCGDRTEEATGAVEAFGSMMRSNAIKKAETQARRRATLAMCGQGWAKPRRKSQPVQIPVNLTQPEKPELVELERPIPQALKILEVESRK